MLKTPIHSSVPAAKSGFTLIEVLIALLVLSIGLLGLAGLQVTSTQLSNAAIVRTATTTATTEMIDKIRMRTGKLSDRTAVLNMVSQYAGSAASDCVPSGGTSAPVANDLACWQRQIGQKLPGGSGTVTDNSDGTYTIRITWDDLDAGQQSVDWTITATSPRPTS